jgi:hypothetical protein
MVLNAEGKAIVIAIVGVVLLVVVGGILASNTGLLFVAGVTSGLIGLIAAGSNRAKGWIRRFATVLAVVVVVAAALGTWAVSLAQGGNLGLFDFLWATGGLLVPAELVVAVLAAGWGAGAGPIRA